MNNIRYWLQLVAVILVAVVLIYVSYRGVYNGVMAGRSETILANAKAMTEGLRYFYADQNRYPSPDEFADRNLMLSYLDNYPSPNIPGGPCEITYAYHSLNYQGYELDFCLPRATADFVQGLNTAKR